MLDFTSALYLGMQHPSWSLRPWPQLTTGAPSALVAPPGAEAVAAGLAELMGCQGAVLAPSTLHVALDLFAQLARERIIIFMDAEVYPITRWGVERAACRGVPVRTLPHHGARSLRRQLREAAGGTRTRARRPVVVTSGFCPGCGRFAPLQDYLAGARAYGGSLVLDDTQALGILAMVPARVRRMGGVAGARCTGTDVADTDVLSFGSLAKGFGVPVAVLAGSQDAVWRFERESQTRVHCSPPSVAVVQAACHALALNRRCGETLRGRLVERVKQFRARLAEAGLGASGGLFPVQTLKPMPGIDPHALHGRLERRGIQTVLHSKPDGNGARLGFILTARHSPEEIDAAVAVVVDALGHQRSARQASKMKVHNERPVCI